MPTLADLSSPADAYAPVEFDKATLKLKRGGANIDHAAAQEEIDRLTEAAGKMDANTAFRLKTKLQQSRQAVNQFLKSQ